MSDLEGLRVNIAIIGGGIIGSALAMSLARRGCPDVVVFDPDLEGQLSSSELNAGGVRATFSQLANIHCSIQSIDYFSKNAASVGYRPCGYLWMLNDQQKRQKEKGLKVWGDLGWRVEDWTISRLIDYAPFIDRTSDLAGAYFAPRDGLLNPNLLKQHYRSEAIRFGAKFVDRALLQSAHTLENGIDLDFESLPTQLDREGRMDALERSWSPRVSADQRLKIRADRVVNCAGPWASAVAKILGYQSPSYCVRRQISLFDCRDLDLSQYGMMIDSSGVYFHPEASYILGGVAERETPQGQNFDYEGIDFFQEKIWAPLAERSTRFEALRHLNGWGGLYEVSPDESAIIGPVECLKGFSEGRVFESHSYSGHGVMHSFAAAEGLSEWILEGAYSSIDLEPFHGRRFETGRLLQETAVI